jgi:hypothetical protein
LLLFLYQISPLLEKVWFQFSFSHSASLSANFWKLLSVNITVKVKEHLE